MAVPTTADLMSVTDETFDEQVRGSALPVLVEFWATWCGPCRMLAPVLAEIAAEHTGRVRVVKVDLDANPGTARDLAVMAAPTTILFTGGEPVASVVGARSKSALLAAFGPHFAA